MRIIKEFFKLSFLKKLSKKQLHSFIIVLFLLILLPFLLLAFKKFKDYRSKAASNSTITINTTNIQGILSRPWEYLAQGGENAKTSELMLRPVVEEIKALKPKIIDADAINFNSMGVIGGKHGQITYDWTKLDEHFRDVVNTGATPVISLDFMPTALNDNAVKNPSFEEDSWWKDSWVFPSGSMTATRESNGQDGSYRVKLQNNSTDISYYTFVGGDIDIDPNDSADRPRYDWSTFARSDSSTPNLVQDPSFEAGISGWPWDKVYGGTKIAATWEGSGYAGEHSLKIVNSGDSQGYWTFRGGQINKYYEWSLYVRSDSLESVPNGVGLTYHGGPEKFFTLSNQWQKISFGNKIDSKWSAQENLWYLIIPAGRTIYIDSLFLGEAFLGLTWQCQKPEDRSYFSSTQNWQNFLVNGKIPEPGCTDIQNNWFIVVPPGKTVYIDNVRLTSNPYLWVFGDSTPPPYWEDWQAVIRETILHYSGKDTSKGQQNLTNVYYEVWNEPEGFGPWRIDNLSKARYQDLYKYAALGAMEAKNQGVNTFKFGGPTFTGVAEHTTTPFRTFFQFVKDNNLLIDFVSWHAYGAGAYTAQSEIDAFNPANMANNIAIVEVIKAESQFAGYFNNKENLITEWGPFGGMPEINGEKLLDSNFAAAYIVHSMYYMLDKKAKPFFFEIKDSADPNGQQPCWGRWGLLTNEKYGLHKKASYNAFKALSSLKTYQLELSGGSENVKGIASKDADGSMAIVLANFDKNRQNIESVNLNLNNLENGDYEYKAYLIDQTHSNYCQNPSSEELSLISALNESVSIQTNNLQKNINMGVNSVLLITLTPKTPTSAPQCTVSVNKNTMAGNETVEITVSGNANHPNVAGKELNVVLWLSNLERKQISTLNLNPQPLTVWPSPPNTVYYQLGKCNSNFDINSGLCSFKVNLSGLPLGSYYLQCDVENFELSHCSGSPFCSMNNLCQAAGLPDCFDNECVGWQSCSDNDNSSLTVLAPQEITPSPTPTTVVTPTPLSGDINGDGRVNIMDYNLLVQDFNKIGEIGFSPADINQNGKVDIFDFNLLVENFGKNI